MNFRFAFAEGSGGVLLKAHTPTPETLGMNLLSFSCWLFSFILYRIAGRAKVTKVHYWNQLSF